jgi:hypothetical protein
MARRWTPSVVPNIDDQNVYLVVDDFGRLGRAYRETDVEEADLETVINDLISGQYKDPIRVIAFNTVERWSEDVSEDVAHEVRRRCDLLGKELSPSIEAFVESYVGRARQLTLRLAP